LINLSGTGLSKNPVLILGNGIHISKAYKEVVELSELLQVPVVTSYKGKSTFSEVHPLSL
jgi:acetolactate synthase-1/2/3 large subunit